MKTIFAVRGVSKQGKSTSVKNLYALLQKEYPNARIEEIFSKVDITIIITVNRIKIGIESQGDPGSRLFASLDRFVASGCKIIVCSTRTRGATVDAVNRLAKKFQIVWIDKQGVPKEIDEDAANKTTAKIIFKQIKALIEQSGNK